MNVLIACTLGLSGTEVRFPAILMIFLGIHILANDNWFVENWSTFGEVFGPKKLSLKLNSCMKTGKLPNIFLNECIFNKNNAK